MTQLKFHGWLAVLWGHGEKALSMREQSQSPHGQQEKQKEEGREALDPGSSEDKAPKTQRLPMGHLLMVLTLPSRTSPGTKPASAETSTLKVKAKERTDLFIYFACCMLCSYNSMHLFNHFQVFSKHDLLLAYVLT